MTNKIISDSNVMTILPDNSNSLNIRLLLKVFKLRKFYIINFFTKINPVKLPTILATISETSKILPEKKYNCPNSVKIDKETTIHIHAKKMFLLLKILFKTKAHIAPVIKYKTKCTSLSLCKKIKNPGASNPETGTKLRKNKIAVQRRPGNIFIIFF
jgi:hypothetical protein